MISIRERLQKPKRKRANTENKQTNNGFYTSPLKKTRKILEMSHKKCDKNPPVRDNIISWPPPTVLVLGWQGASLYCVFDHVFSLDVPG